MVNSRGLATGEHVADLAAAAGVGGRGGGGLSVAAEADDVAHSHCFRLRSSHINIIKPNS